MNEFKVQSCMGVREGWWRDAMTNRKSKRPARRQARHNLKKGDKNFQKILQETLDKRA